MASKSKIIIQAQDNVTPELRKIQKEISNFQKSIDSVGKGFGNLLKAGGALIGFQAIKGIVTENINLFMEFEKENQKLIASLTQGSKTSVTMANDFKKLADELENVSNIDDKLTLAQTAKLASLNRSKSEIDSILRASADMSVALGISFDSAVDMLNKTFSGNVPKQLGNMIPEIKNLSAESLKAGGAVALVGRQFQGIGANSNSGAYGAINRLTNSFEDMGKETGRYLANAGEPFISWLGDLLGASSKTLASLNNMNEAQKRLIRNTYVLGDAGKIARLNDKATVYQSFEETQNSTRFKLKNSWGKNYGFQNFKDALVRGNLIGAEEIDYKNLSLVFENLGLDLKNNWTPQAYQKLLDNWDLANRNIRGNKGKAQDEIKTLEDKIASKKINWDNSDLGANISYTTDDTRSPFQKERDNAFNSEKERISFRDEFWNNWVKALKDGNTSEQELLLNLGKAKGLITSDFEESEASLQAQKKTFQDNLKEFENGFSVFKSFQNEISNLFSSIFNHQSQVLQNEIEGRKESLKNLEETYNKELETKRKLGEDTTAFELENMEKINSEKAGIEAEEKRLKKEQFESQKQGNIIGAIMNTAEGVTKALSAAPPPLNFALAGLTGAAGAVQIGLIASQPTPKFALGTPFAQGGLSLVGETGAELVSLPRGSQVFNSNRTKELVNQNSSAPVYNITVNGSIIAESELFKKIATETNKLKARGQL